ncbi:unnamed protein product [Trichobilharzia szidati]|nr:unnamed protein product [Trichobilharzia szidati]
MDSQTSNSDNIEELLKQSKDNFNAFKSIRERLTKPTVSVEYTNFVQTLTEHLHELPLNSVKKLLFSSIDPVDWMILNNPTVSENMINLYVISISYFPNLTYEICEYCINQVFYFKDSIEQLDTINHLNNLNSIAIDFFTALCQNISHSTPILVDLLIKRFPNWRKPVKELLWATFSILSLLSCQKASKLLSNTDKCNVLSMIFTAIIELELNPDGVTHENLLPLFDETTPIYAILQKFDKTDLEAHLNNLFNIIQGSIVDDKNWLKIELLSWLLISYISSICTKGNDDSTSSSSSSTPQFDWDLLCSIFRRARDLFSEYILPVNVPLLAYPMVCFYMCSLRGGLVISFIDFLWNTIKDEHRDQGSRLMALSYLCFILVNGKFCFIDLVIEIMHNMTTWCIDYTYRHRRQLTVHSTVLLSENKLYYAVCDVLIYIFVQLHSELLRKEHFESCNRLPMAQISISPFKPLLHTPRRLRQTFFQIISVYHMSWSTIGLTQSINADDDDVLKENNAALLNWMTVDSIRSLLPSNILRMLSSRNCCPLSLSSITINRLFRDIRLGERLISNNSNNVLQQGESNSNCDVQEKVSPKSPRKSKRKASSVEDLGVESTTNGGLIAKHSKIDETST